VDAQAVAAAFGLGRAIGPLIPHLHSTWPTWRLRTTGGDAFVKRLDCLGWQAELEQSMAFERAARAAGVAMPEPCQPVQPAFGYVTEVDGIHLRAHRWVTGRPVAPTDDLGGWLGATLAILHRLQPVPRAEPTWYGLRSAGQWRAWQQEAAGRGLSWAPLLADRLPLVLAASERIAATFAGAGDYVLAHQDLRPHNLLVTEAGPVLTDWDASGPDSAALEAADAIVLLALEGREHPSAEVIERACAAYRDAGGGPVVTETMPLARRAGHRLLHIGERIERSLTGSAADERYVADRLTDLPDYLDLLDAYAAMLPR
jgi:Ser/Thr protein kinase RdoA (MazF antagonist)